MKRRSKKLISLLVATGLLAGSLAGCGNSDKGSDPSSGSEAGTETGAEAGAENLSIVVSHQPYSHGLPSYIGEQEGTFSDAGFSGFPAGIHRMKLWERMSGKLELMVPLRLLQQVLHTTPGSLASMWKILFPLTIL